MKRTYKIDQAKFESLLETLAGRTDLKLDRPHETISGYGLLAGFDYTYGVLTLTIIARHFPASLMSVDKIFGLIESQGGLTPDGHS